MSLRDEILQADDLPTEKVTVPEWGKTVYVRSMTALERDEYESDLIKNRDAESGQLMYARSKLVALCTVDDKGDRIFEWDDVEALSKKSAKAISRVAEAAQLLNAIGDTEVEEISGN